MDNDGDTDLKKTNYWYQKQLKQSARRCGERMNERTQKIITNNNNFS